MKNGAMISKKPYPGKIRSAFDKSCVQNFSKKSVTVNRSVIVNAIIKTMAIPRKRSMDGNRLSLSNIFPLFPFQKVYHIQMPV